MELKGEEKFEGHTAQLLILLEPFGFTLNQVSRIHSDLVLAKSVRKHKVNYRGYSMRKVHYHFNKQDVLDFLGITYVGNSVQQHGRKGSKGSKK
jgi:hypothetical protein